MSQSVVAPPGTRKGYEWTARIRCIENELGTNFHVYIFLGDIPEPPADLITHPNYVGSYDTFFDGIPHSTAKRRSQGDSSASDGPCVQGFVNLTRVMVKREGHAILEPENATSYLKDNLKWCIETHEGRADLDELPSLEVMVLEVPMTLKAGDRIPKVGVVKEHPEVTRGKQGGTK
ncbi:hypothetical protein FRB90_004453 [Tulasnella sp. 427]|nr:hypothetical protein FRB90_004453 [Tulasnella sp. 427]